MRHEAPRHIPSTAGRDSEGGSWIRWLTWTRKRKGTVACQKSNGRAQAYEARCCGIRVIRRKLDCLYPNLQEMQVEHPPERRLKTGATPCVGMARWPIQPPRCGAIPSEIGRAHV